jgi:thymidylate synthase (FAD)
MQKIDVLDHGFVRLVESMGSDLSIVRAARVSHDAAWRAGEDEGGDERLIRYLWRNRHTTPFEAVEFQFEIKAPIFVFRQWHRHRTWTYNEVSARYTELPEEFYVPKPELVGKQSTSNKQARIVADLMCCDEDDPMLGLRETEVEFFRHTCSAAFEQYRALLDSGWPRELARSVLPVATYSHMFAKVDLHNLFHFLGLRLHAHAQYEIRVYAEAMLELIRGVVPVAVAAWEDGRSLEGGAL